MWMYFDARSPRLTRSQGLPVSPSSFPATTGRSGCQASSPGISTRLGALDPSKEPYASILEKADVNVVDLTSVASIDAFNHSKFASGEVVSAIGDRLAEGQTLTDAKPGMVETLGAFTRGALNVASEAATAPTRIADPTLQEKSVDTVDQSVTLQK